MILSIAWAPDGRSLAASESRRGICFWDLYTGGLTSALEFHFDVAKRLAWSPNGQILAILLSEGEVQFHRKFEKTVTPKAKLSERAKSVAWAPDGHTIAFGRTDGEIELFHLESARIVERFVGHSDAILGLTWSPDGGTLVSAGADRTVRLWSLSTKHQSTILEGHTSQVLNASFSADGRLLASRSSDRDIWFWRSDTATKVASLKEIAKKHDESPLGVVFHPNESAIALVGHSNNEIYIWDFKPEIVLNLGSADPTFRYTNAKVVLVGNSGVGKSGLGLVLSGQPFSATESTHGRHVWIFDTREVALNDGRKETREILLWDLAGQPGYRLIHQLHLNEVALALVVFDMRSETDPFSGVRHWDRALRQSQRVSGGSIPPMRKLLIAARSDRGGVGVSSARIETLQKDLEFDAYFETSAKEAWGIPELASAIHEAMDWDALPKVISTELFQRIKSFLVDEKQARRILSTTNGLYRTFLKSDKELQDSEELFAQFETCIGRVESRGLIRRLSFGNLVLLQPELLDSYASAIVNAAKDEPDGLGSIAEEDVLNGRFRMSKDERIDDKEQERLLLIATVEEMLLHEVALREQASDGLHLVFPAQLTRENPDLPDPQGKAVTFRFEGPIQNIYATLAVRLSHSGFFKKDEMWKNAATFRVPTEGICGMFLRELGEARAELTLFFNNLTARESRSHFEEYVAAHLSRRALPETISRRLIVICNGCGFVVTDQLAKLRHQRGFDWLDCPGCGHRVSLKEPREEPAIAKSSLVVELDRAADSQRDFEAGLVSAAGEMRSVGFKKWAGASMATIAVVFTDIVGSTNLNSELGNEMMNKVRKRHFEQGRELVDELGGYQIKTVGDSLMVAFRTVVTALDFVLHFRLSTGDDRVAIRAGIHVGPVHIEDEDAFGSMVNFAARVTAFAKGPEIWLSNPAKDHIDQEKAQRHTSLRWYQYSGRTVRGFPGRHFLWSDVEPPRKKVSSTPEDGEDS
jgi:class 3 adenylate cyclase/GTPase SAR1 family protein